MLKQTVQFIMPVQTPFQCAAPEAPLLVWHCACLFAVMEPRFHDSSLSKECKMDTLNNIGAISLSSMYVCCYPKSWTDQRSPNIWWEIFGSFTYFPSKNMVFYWTSLCYTNEKALLIQGIWLVPMRNISMVGTPVFPSHVTWGDEILQTWYEVDKWPGRRQNCFNWTAELNSCYNWSG